MKKLIVILSLLFPTVLSAQKFKIVEGDFSFLKNASKVNVKFTYDNLRLLKENKTEAVYVDERSKELNAKNSGTGDNWKKKWEASKSSIWETNFLDLMAKTVTEKQNIVFGENLKDAKYTLVVDAVWIYPGWDAAVMKQAAKVSTLLIFSETANPGKVLLKIESTDAPGDQYGSNFSNESRIGEGFEKTAKTLGKRILKEI